MSNKVIGKIPYSLALRPSNPTDKHSEKKVYATAQIDESVDLKTLAKHMRQHGSSYSVGTLQGVLTDMVECTLELLKQGKSVNYDGLMRLHVTISSDPVDKAEDFNPQSHIRRVNLRGDVDETAKSFLNSDVDFEYVLTREAQAKAKKETKESLIGDGAEGDDNGDDNGGGDITGGDDQTE